MFGQAGSPFSPLAPSSRSGPVLMFDEVEIQPDGPTRTMGIPHHRTPRDSVIGTRSSCRLHAPLANITHGSKSAPAYARDVLFLLLPAGERHKVKNSTSDSLFPVRTPPISQAHQLPSIIMPWVGQFGLRDPMDCQNGRACVSPSPLLQRLCNDIHEAVQARAHASGLLAGR